MAEEEEVQQHTVVIDNGSRLLKAGFAGEDAPRGAFETLLGWPRHPGVGGMMLGAPKDSYIGHEAAENRGLLALKHPIHRGKVVDWEDMEKVWHHTLYSTLVVAPEEHPVLHTEIPGTTRAEREKMATIMFEIFNVPALYMANQCVLSLYSTGRTTGVVLESGDMQTHVAPVWEGYALPHRFRSLPIAGGDVTSYLMNNLRAEGYPFSTVTDQEHVRAIKETLCYTCTTGYEAELAQCDTKQSYERQYTMPDGAVINLTRNRFQPPEVLFNPALMGMEDVQGVHRAISSCVLQCAPDLRREMYSNLVLGGGNTLFPKFEDRLQREVAGLVPKGTPVKVVALPERQYAAWLGGSLLASLHTFPCMWISKLEYDEYGYPIIHRKC
eukprot:EG_transcript_14815